MYSVLKKNVPGKIATYREFIADLVEDIDSLPGVNACAPGSICYCSEDGNIYILENDGDWVIKSSGGGGSLASLSDVNITNPTDGQILIFNAETNMWVNGDNVARVGADVVNPDDGE